MTKNNPVPIIVPEFMTLYEEPLSQSPDDWFDDPCSCCGMTWHHNVTTNTSSKNSGRGIRVIPYPITCKSSHKIKRDIVHTKNGDITVIVKHKE